MEAFSFGDPVAVLHPRELLDCIECQRAGEWFEQPMPRDGLARTFRAAVHNSSPIYVKRNIFVSTFIPHKLLSRTAFARWAQDSLVFGNEYLERRDIALGRPVALEPALA
jgi:capsid portal protein